MSKSTLIGSNKVSEAEVIQVPEVAFTETYHPIHHSYILDAIRSAVSAVGLEVKNKEYVLANEGKKMFGVWDLSGAGSDEIGFAIGIRNSMDKSMALGITAGTRVFVCENLAFSGEFVAFRKHTNGLVYHLLESIAYQAMKQMVSNLSNFQAWHEGLKDFALTENDAKLLLVEIMSNNVIPPSKFSRFDDLYFGGKYEPTLWGFHEAVTDLLRGTNLLTLPKKNKLLNGVLDTFIDASDIDPPSHLGEFYESRNRLCNC